MILQGVRHPVPYPGVSYTNDPQRGYMAYARALDLTTLFEVIFQTPNFGVMLSTYVEDPAWNIFVIQELRGGVLKP